MDDTTQEVPVEETTQEEVRDEQVEQTRDVPTLVHRATAMDFKPIDEKARTVRMAISSEAPVRRSYGNEILKHAEGAVDLSFLQSGRAPLLLDHDMTKQIGVVSDARLDSDGVVRASVRFGKGDLASSIFEDVKDGIRSNVSIGYSVEKMQRGKGDDYVATDWRIYEVSIVSVPADTGVGVGRSYEVQTENMEIKPILKEDKTMSDFNLDEVRAEMAAKTDEQISSKFNAFESRVSSMLDKMEQRSAQAIKDQEIGLTEKEVRNFSLVKAIRALANPNDRKAQEAAAYELECSRAAAERSGRNPEGILLPVDVMRNWSRDLNTTDEASLIAPDYRGSDFIDVLRNNSAVMGMGARMLNNLSGDVTIPKKLTASSAAWIATEGAASAASEMTVGSVALTPKTLGANTTYSRKLLIQSDFSVEQLVRDDLAQALALAIDLAALEGTGASGQPTGVLNTAGVTKVATFAAVNPSFSECVSLETSVANQNALAGSPGYILRSNMAGALKTTEKATGTAQFVYQGGEINGYRANISNQGTDGNIYFGNWNDLIIGMFGGLDLIVDPYSGATTGNVTVTCLQSLDIAVRHAASFAYGNDTI